MSKYRKIDKEEMRRLLIDMMDVFDAYAKEHSLQYYMAGGTALGAVRHGGFIPWDDDIDLAMPRPDYDRFLELVKTEPLADNLKVISGDDGTCAWPFADIVNTDTRVKRKTDQFLIKKFRNPHLYIDIFPCDGFPRSPKAKKRLVRKMAILRKLLLHSRSKMGQGTSPVRAAIKILSGMLGRAVGMERLKQKIISLAKAVPYEVAIEEGIVTNCIYGVGEAFPKAQARPYAKMKFEGKEYPIPACYDSYLRGIYGDYMELPPEEDRKDHGMTVYIKE